ncbi:MAG: AAA family ATPase [Deltaproteobacteria bacterium]|nr:AAA family ATPase [Deltaproteobacteria bacterium]MBW2341659.1 AAA family ATPase [Deltaproteobacteria bacterium]
MLQIDELGDAELHNIRIACAYLFSPQVSKDDRFLKSLKLETVKKAFREKAKRYHPDLHGHERKGMITRRMERFIKIQESYEILACHFQEKGRPAFEKGIGQGKIIAVGGAKGGIGKSIFAANLGVLLSSIGWKTVVADLDLGGANLHLYLGETFPEWNINDFLNKRASALEEIVIKNRYGPKLIGGDSSQLGASNISFSRKLHLLRATRNIDADYVIIDLGGDTSYNIIDFFLAADHGIVMTTCDPASYLDAYSFIKVALYRKLNRLFGSESAFRHRRDIDLQKLIHQATMSTNGSQVKSIEELLVRIREQRSQGLPLVRDAISTFNPHLIVNRITHNSNASQVVKRIQEVSRKMLSIRVGYLGGLPYKPEIECSARDLIPIVARYPRGEVAKEMNQMMEKLLWS